MKQFLIIQTAFIGDAILASALLEKLHAFYPDAQIDLLVRKGNETLFTGHPFLRTLHVWNKQVSKYQEMFRLIRVLRKTEYDHLINAQRFASTGFITWRAKAKEKVGYDKNPFAWCFDRQILHRLDGVHEVDRLNDLIAHITDGSRPMPKLYPGEQHLAELEATNSGPFVCMAPTSVWSTKQWPAEKWVGLIRALPSETRVCLLGGPGDRDACEKILKASGRENVINLAGALSLLASAALMAKAQMNYVNDSAPLHLASAMNAPVRAVFCSTVPSFGFGPLSQDGKVVQTSKVLDCRPCGLHGKSECPKGHFECAMSISSKKVAEA